jgi:cell division protein FtsN
MSNTTNKGHVLLGLILGLMVAVFAALIAFMLMTKSSSPLNSNVTDNDGMTNNSKSNKSNEAKDPNSSLHSRVPYGDESSKKDANQNNNGSGGNSENSDTDFKKNSDGDTKITSSTPGSNKSSEEVMQNIIEKGQALVSPQGTEKKIKKPKKELPEYIDKYGEKHIGTPTKEAISVDNRDEEENKRKIKEAKEEKERLARDENPNLEIDPIKNMIAKNKELNKDKESKNKKDPKIKSNIEDGDKVVKAKIEKSGTFYVQVNSFKSAEQADKQKATLLMNNFNAKVSQAERDGSTVHRVRVGPFYSRAEVDAVTKRLVNDGMAYKIIKTEEE